MKWNCFAFATENLFVFRVLMLDWHELPSQFFYVTFAGSVGHLLIRIALSGGRFSHLKTAKKHIHTQAAFVHNLQIF